jgi:hypothetical protein
MPRGVRANNASCNLVWGVLWLLIAICFFALGVIVGLVAFKVRFACFIFVLSFVIDDGTI